MPIQAQVIRVAIEGHDLLGIAKTGSGKTASEYGAIIVYEPMRLHKVCWVSSNNPTALAGLERKRKKRYVQRYPQCASHDGRICMGIPKGTIGSYGSTTKLNCKTY